MANLNELQLGAEAIGDKDTDFDTIPDQMSAFADPIQPGPYRFRLPTQMGNIWEPLEKTGKNPGKRIQAKFDRDNPLTIVQSVGDKHTGEPFETRISNSERKRGKDENAPEASDMDYLLRDSFGMEKKPRDEKGQVSNKAYAMAMIGFAGKEFSADVEWSWRCNPDKPIRVEAEGGGYVEVPEQNGCGARYYQKDVAKVHANPDDPTSPLVYPVRITCGGGTPEAPCGASVRAYGNLVRFRK